MLVSVSLSHLFPYASSGSQQFLGIPCKMAAAALVVALARLFTLFVLVNDLGSLLKLFCTMLVSMGR